MLKIKIIFFLLLFLHLTPSLYSQNRDLPPGSQRSNRRGSTENTNSASQKSISNSVFNIRYSEQGITSLTRINDKYDTEYIASGSTLGGLIIRYRTSGQSEWQEISEIMSLSSDGQEEVFITYTIGNSASGKDLKVTEQFKLNGEALDWTITLANESNEPLEIGDLAVPTYFSERTPRGRGHCGVWRSGWEADR